MSSSIREDLCRVFEDAADGQQPTMPDELLYDDKGLFIWADIIFTPEFYQTADEAAIFEENSHAIARHIQKGAVMVDLGAGDMDKVNLLLRELARQGRETTYLALDISKKSLASNLVKLHAEHAGGSVHVAGLWGDFDAGLRHCKSSAAGEDDTTPRVFLSLGSVLFNDPWAKAVASLKRWAALMRPSDLILAGMDGHDVRSRKVWDAYHSHPDLFERFFHNGFDHANKLLGEVVFRPLDWDICAEVDAAEKRHRFFVRARRDVMLEGDDGGVLREGVELDWFDAHKRNEVDVRKMCAQAGLEVIASWAKKGSDMRQYLIRLETGGEVSSDENDSGVSVSGT
ncbi:Ergothioneine biosynthesis protein 1 [Colletotrichum spinosum]|uniref:4-dimethylallyltryptophan N-methyltransferase n=1 Tax=Colletotrichum spinosum TaxID=1347390 RepID=A0A4R8QJ24_9PEZI|nr:Ergothioneine biosynthesis protein 1 [Colletotrichum spinosum]